MYVCVSGAVDSNKTVFLDNTAVLVVSRGVYTAMKIIPKDSFGNKADIEEHLVDIEIRQVRGRGLVGGVEECTCE